MRERLTGIALIVGGIIAALSPIALSTWILDHDARDREQAVVLSYAQDALYRSNEVADQMLAAFVDLGRLEAREGPCGEAGLAEMRRLDLASRYIQAVGKVVGTRMECSSLGLPGEQMELGPVDAEQPTGLRLRLNVRFPFAKEDSFLVIEQFGFAAIIHKGLPIDTALSVKNVALATFSTASGTILTSRGPVDPAWIKRAIHTAQEQFVTDSHVVAALGSKRYLIGALAAMPATTLLARIGDKLVPLTSIGLCAGLLIAGLFTHLASRQRALPAVLRRALRRHEFFLMYQPVIDLKTGRWIGAEALIRWRRRAGETVRPDTFIPVAEEYGLIGQITRRVIELVGQDAKGLFTELPDFHLALNLSTLDLYNPATVGLVDELIETTRASPGNLILEITERSFTDGQKAAGILGVLRGKGVTVAIDDFGTGYSNLNLLQTLQLDYLKIDKSFVDTIGTESASSGVVFHVISMARSLGLKIIAEGVETEAQARTLMHMGVEYAQGWHFAKAMTFDELLEGLRRRAEVVG